MRKNGNWDTFKMTRREVIIAIFGGAMMFSVPYCAVHYSTNWPLSEYDIPEGINTLQEHYEYMYYQEYCD